MTTNALDRPRLNDLILLGERITAAGFTAPAVFAKASAARDAMLTLVRPGSLPSVDLNDPTSTATAWRDYYTSILLDEYRSQRPLTDAAEESILTAAKPVLASSISSLITAMNSAFTTALAAVQDAHSKGIRITTTTDDLIKKGDAQAIAAYNALPAAVGTLDRISGLRLDLARIGSVGVVDPLVANVVASVRNQRELVGAQGILDGALEPTFDNTQYGRTLAYRQRPRVGGAWLDLITAGITPKINTAAEAAAVAGVGA